MVGFLKISQKNMKFKKFRREVMTLWQKFQTHAYPVNISMKRTCLRFVVILNGIILSAGSSSGLKITFQRKLKRFAVLCVLKKYVRAKSFSKIHILSDMK